MECYAMLTEVSVTAEPLDIADVKNYLSLRDSETHDDAFLSDAIRECRSVIEQSTGRFLCEAAAKAVAYASDISDIRLRGPITDVLSAVASPSGESLDHRVVGPCTIRVEPPPGTDSVTVSYRSRGLPLDPGLRGILLATIKRRYERQERLLSDDISAALAPYMQPNI